MSGRLPFLFFMVAALGAVQASAQGQVKDEAGLSEVQAGLRRDTEFLAKREIHRRKLGNQECVDDLIASLPPKAADFAIRVTKAREEAEAIIKGLVSKLSPADLKEPGAIGRAVTALRAARERLPEDQRELVAFEVTPSSQLRVWIREKSDPAFSAARFKLETSPDGVRPGESVIEGSLRRMSATLPGGSLISDFIDRELSDERIRTEYCPNLEMSVALERMREATRDASPRGEASLRNAVDAMHAQFVHDTVRMAAKAAGPQADVGGEAVSAPISQPVSAPASPR